MKNSVITYAKVCDTLPSNKIEVEVFATVSQLHAGEVGWCVRIIDDMDEEISISVGSFKPKKLGWYKRLKMRVTQILL